MEMDQWQIIGGMPLQGEVRISGAKNAVLPALAASILTDEEIVFQNAPSLRDVSAMCEILQALGCAVSVEDSISVRALRPVGEASPEIMRQLRASILILGPMLARNGYARVAMPGGCSIGLRPIDLHIKGFSKMGIKFRHGGGYVEAEGRLKGASLYLDFPSVGATENLMMGAALAEGTTRIENAAKEPEIVDLANLLIEMGAKISGAGSTLMTIEGVPQLHGCTYAPISDRIEAGTLMCGVAAVGGNVLLRGARAAHMSAVLYKLREAGLKVSELKDGIRCRGTARAPIDLRTGVYPGFPTDLQAPIMAVTCFSRGVSVIRETVFENRYMHVPELTRMGAEARVEDHTAIIRGGKLTGARVRASDLRAGAGLVVAALGAQGETILEHSEHIDRGYEGLDVKLCELGAQVYRGEAMYIPQREEGIQMPFRA